MHAESLASSLLIAGKASVTGNPFAVHPFHLFDSHAPMHSSLAKLMTRDQVVGHQIFAS